MSRTLLNLTLTVTISGLLTACSADRPGEVDAPVRRQAAAPVRVQLGSSPRIERDGVLVCAPEAFTNRIAASLRQRLTDSTSVRQAIAIFGPGYISPDSGTGSIQWFFDDGVCLQTSMWPESLDAPFRPRVTKAQVYFIR